MASLEKVLGPQTISVFVSSLSTLAIKVLSAGLIYTMFVLTARSMTLAEYGRFSVGFNLASFLAVVASCGVHVGINRWWPEYVAKQQPHLATAAYQWGLRVTGVAALALVAAAFVVAALYWATFNVAEAYIFAAIIMLVPMALADYMANALRAQGSLFWAQMPKDIIWRVFGCIVALSSIASGARLRADAAIWIITGALASLVALQAIIAARTVVRTTLTQEMSSQTVGEERTIWVKIAWALWGGAVLNAMVQNVDVLLVGAFISVEQSGEYFAAVRTVNLLSLMHVAATLVCAPIISKYFYSNRLHELQDILRTVSLLVGTCTLIIFCGLIFAGPFLLSLFGQNFSRGYPLLLVLGVGFSFNALCGAVGYFLMIAGFELKYLKILVVTYSISFVIQLILIPTIGPMGAAIGSSGALIVSGFWSRKVALQSTAVDPTAFCVFAKRRRREN